MIFFALYLEPFTCLSPNVFKIDQQRMMKYNQIMGVHEEIRSKILRRLYEFSKHAVDQSIIRDISVAEMEEAKTRTYGWTSGSGSRTNEVSNHEGKND